MNMRTKMVRWGLRAGLMLVALLLVLGVSCLIPAAEEGGTAVSQELKSCADGASPEGNAQAPNADALPEIYDGVIGIPGSKLDGDSWEDRLLPSFEYSKLVGKGGSNYVNSAFNKSITEVRDLFLPLGYCVMFVCWIIGMCKSGISLNFDLGAKDGILRSGLTLMLCLFLMEVSMEIMESLSALCWEYCDQLVSRTKITSLISTVLPAPEEADSFFEQFIDSLGYIDDIIDLIKGAEGGIKELGVMFLFFIVEAVLVLNVAYMGLLQCFSPIFVGFAAGGEGTRRFATGFFKEYLKVCLVPPVIMVYLALCFNLFLSSSVGWFLCIVLGISVFGIGKKLDKIIA